MFMKNVAQMCNVLPSVQFEVNILAGKMSGKIEERN